MSVKTSPSMAQIAGDLRGARFRAEFRSSWATAVLYRVPGLPLVWLCARIGASPTAVTLVALVLALSFPVQAQVLPLGVAVWTVAISGAVFQVLDCTDGTLARITNTTSLRGARLDFLVDMAQWGLLYLAIGILADRVAGGGWAWTAVAVSAAWVRLFARLIRDLLSEPHVTSIEAIAPGPFGLLVAFVAGLSGLLPFLALAGSYLWLSVLALLIYALLDVGEGLLPLFAPGRA